MDLPFPNFLNPNERYYWGWIVCYAVIAFIFAFKRNNLKSALLSIFPRNLYLSQDALLTYKLYLATMWVPIYVSGVLFKYHEQIFVGPIKTILLAVHLKVGIFANEHEILSNLCFSFLMLLAIDIADTAHHILFHKIPFLWEFHKVHHSATAPNIMAASRMHPVEKTVQVTMIMASTIFCNFLVTNLLGHQPAGFFVANVSFALLIRHVFELLRHSHVRISFGFLEYIFSSPSMHQIHHSIDPKHYNKNFASTFSLFDLMMGSIYRPQKNESIIWGIQPEAWGQRNFGTVLGNLIHPFMPVFLLRRLKPDSPKMNSTA
jgi:sterol desaturase/sphingolipid hydroxylase (fatty acid hydroxylase superfamily)